jgi:tyrosinase
METLTRRKLVRLGLGAAVGLGVVGAPWSRPARAAAAPFVRRDIAGLTASDPVMTAWANGIAAMKALPATDPRSWTYQAAIHGSAASPLLTAWDTCEHHNSFFWTWHRMYLYYFERIVRSLSGSPDWALPYWNYANPSQRQLPAMFRTAGGPFHVVQRSSVMNSGGSLLSSDVDNPGGFSQTDFLTAGSQLELTPHDAIHVRIGGWMGAFETAALDPIFWVHHCNIDRLWNHWLAQGGRTYPEDATWRNTPYAFFDETGRQVTLTGCDVFRAAGQLNYTYEGEPPQVVKSCLVIDPTRFKFLHRLLYKFPIPPILVKRKPLPFPVRLDIRPVRARLAGLRAKSGNKITLQLEQVRVARPPGVVWQVFLAPQGSKLDARGPFFVGNLAFFGPSSGAHHDAGPRTFSFAADNVLARGLRGNPNALVLTFVPTGPLRTGSRPFPAQPRT